MDSPDTLPPTPADPTPEPMGPAPQLELLLEHEEVTSFARQQAGMPLLHRLELRLAGDEALRGATIRIAPEPAFADPLDIPLADLEPGASVVLGDRELLLAFSPAYLAAQRERVNGSLRVTVEATGTTLATKVLPVAVLAYNEWSGLRNLPEILAAFVTPNLPSVNLLLAEVAEHLRAATGNPSLDGYQAGDPARVLRMAEGVYLAMRAHEIIYVSPPASYEKTGQKIRFPDEVLAAHQGTCLDLALLACAVLEQAGLHPLLVMESGHAYAGCWLQPDGLPEAVGDDARKLRMEFDSKSLTVFETTLAVSGSMAPYAMAEAEGRRKLEDAHGKFRYVIDICRARANRIRPLPVEVQDGRILVVPPPADAMEIDTVDDAVLGRRFRTANDSVVEELPADRLKYWANQLLDLSMRNRLLNFGRTKCVQVQTHALDLLEDKLAANEEFQLLPTVENDPRSAALHTAQHAEDLEKQRLEADLQARKLRLAAGRGDIERQLTGLRRDARLALEEGGANTLFLALGTLEWIEPGKPGRVYKAPILLMPVQLTCKSVRSGHRLRRIDEETRINITLLEKLARDFQIEVRGVNPPPEDDSGVDLGIVFQRFRKAVKDIPGFEVKEEAWLGIFQFTKFLLWKDLMDRAADLRRSGVVRHLIDTPREPYAHEAEIVEPATLDDELSPERNHCILESDSSQLSAVMSAAAGASFVLIGPPGTGKSQTISNIIAFLIAMGRTVLFVAEKRAALEVVQRRLDGAGLAPFCLELHSNKTGKTEFFEQLRKAVDYAPPAEPEEWARDTLELKRQRERLNDTVAALHRRLGNGYSAYRCHALLMGQPEARRPRLTFRSIEQHTPEHVARMREKVRELAIRMGDFPEPAIHPLAPVHHTQWTPDWEDAALAALDRLDVQAAALEQALAAMLGTLRLPTPPTTIDTLDTLRTLARHLTALPPLPPDALARRPQELAGAAERAMGACVARRTALAALDEWHIDAVLDLDVLARRRDWLHAQQAFILVRPFKKKTVLTALAPLRKDAALPDPDRLEEFFERAERLKFCEKHWKDACAEATPFFGPLWKNGSPDETAFRAAVAWHATLHQHLGTLAGTDLGLLRDLKGALVALAESGADLAGPFSAFRDAIDAFVAAVDVFFSAWQRAGELLAMDPRDWERAVMPAASRQLAAGVSGAARQLQYWCHYRALRHEVDTLELYPLLKLADEGLLHADMSEVFELGYAEASLRRLLQEEELLRTFFGDTQGERIRQFRKLDEVLLPMAARIVAREAARRRPQTHLQGDRPVGFGELGILNAELGKRSRHRPIRQLLKDLPTVLPAFKPCLLMSPLSVAQYLDPAHPAFDVVIFDEASQIPVADAVGAMARGSQVIVAGDPRQLPPTSFFQRGSTDLEDEPEPETDGVVRDAESILDECRSAQVPLVHLRWHYRSRHESLIAFSNHHYYDGNLLTHPEPWAEERGVQWHPVDGVYDRSGSATNKAEAAAVVAWVARHVKDPVLRRQSIGVVTFNSNQQLLIEDLLDKARAEDPELDDLLGKDRAEPVFVKNLENVQGDERDVILFSITYGPDASGNVYHNFGPLNQVGGERRLNVAVTRARRQIHVFSTLRPEQIDLGRTRALGARQLKAYLEYAARGPSSLPMRVVKAADDETVDDPFVTKVADVLRAGGYNVRTRIGCSSYRMDLAVVHPEHPDCYAIGIECDGPAYRDAATARDRDRLRQEVLGNLGWCLHRIWSAEWFRNPDKERDKLLEVVRAAIAEFRPPDEPAAKDPEPVEVEAVVPDAPNSKPAAPPPPADTDRADDDPEEAPERISRVSTFPQAGTPYQAHRRPSVDIAGLDPYDPAAAEAITDDIVAVIQDEGPVSHPLLCARIASLLGKGRNTTKLQERIAELVPRGVPRRARDGIVYYWPKGAGPETYGDFRTHSAKDEGRRALDDICPEEQANAMAHIVRTFMQVPTEDLLRQAAALFGYASLTRAARDALAPGLRLLARRADIVKSGDGYVFKG